MICLYVESVASRASIHRAIILYQISRNLTIKMYICKTPGSSITILNEKPTGSWDWNTGLAINESESVSMEKECAHQLNSNFDDFQSTDDVNQSSVDQQLH